MVEKMGKEKKTKIKSKEYPAISLLSAIAFVDKLKNLPINKPIDYEIAAKEIKVSPTTKSFTYSISAARQSGLISTSSASNIKTISILEAGKRLILPTEDKPVLDLLKLQCFALPTIYSELLKEYNGRALPPISSLENALIKYGIAPNVSNRAAQVFIDSANEVGAVNNGVLSFNSDEPSSEQLDSEETNNNEVEGENVPPCDEPILDNEFEPPLSIPFGNKRKGLLYMPINITAAEAEYAKIMILAMFKQLYGVD